MHPFKLRKYMENHNITPARMAEAAGIDISTWYRKMQKSGETFTVKEMNAMIEGAHMDKGEAAEIFFDEHLESAAGEAERRAI